MNIATVVSFLYISRVPKIIGKCAIFLAHIYRESVFSLKAHSGGVMALPLLRNFYFVLVYFAKIK